MARPRKIDDYIVRRLADFFHHADTLPFSKLLISGDKRFRIPDAHDIHCGIGELLCNVKPEKRIYVLRRLIDVLKGHSKRKTPPDEIALARIAWRKAKAKLKGVYRGGNPTFEEADTEFSKDNGYHLDRRALRDAGCPLRPGKRPGRRGRQE